jgi:hypothetical protein
MTQQLTEIPKFTHGGARPNSGRTPSEHEYEYLTIRIRKDILDELKLNYPSRGALADIVREQLTTLFNENRKTGSDTPAQK